MNEGHTSNPPRLRSLIFLTAGAIATGTLLTVGVVMPAEFGRDPIGIGTLLGLTALGKGLSGLQVGEVARYYDAPFRVDVLEIPFAADGDSDGRSEVGYKVRMKAGQTLIYAWEATGVAEDQFYFDLHTETLDAQLIGFKQETGTRSDGALVAAADGVHGWNWQNRSVARVVLRLRIAGFYELIAPGEPGNEAGLTPTRTLTP